MPGVLYVYENWSLLSREDRRISRSGADKDNCASEEATAVGIKYIKMSFIIYNPNETPFGEEITTNELGWTCGRHGVEEKVTGTWCGNLTERDHL